jgi:V/A-type H+-transporting ATPase subunit I
MAIATLNKAELVAPRHAVPDLLQSLEQAALLHVDDVHDGLPDELAQWEERDPVDTSPVDGVLASARWILDLFQRFAPHKTGMLEDFFGSPPAVDDGEFARLVASVDVHAYRAELEQRLAEYENVVAELDTLRERIARVTPWAELGVDLSAVSRSRHAALTAIRVPVAAVPELESLLAERGGHLRLAPVSQAAKTAYAVVVSLPADLDAVGVALRQVRGEEVELPRLPASAADALQAARQQSGELEQRRDRLAAALAAEAHERRRALQAIADEYENRRAGLDARGRVFYSRHAAVIVGWVEETRRPALEELLAVHHPQVRYRLSDPDTGDSPPVKLENGRLTRPFQTLISMYGMPNYFGVDPTPFVAVAMTVFYAIALGDFGYGVLQIMLAAWLRKRFRSVGETRLFLTMFVYMGVATLVVGVLTWSFFGFTPGASGDDKFLGFLPLVYPTRDIIPLIGISVGVGIVFQLASITAGFINLLKRGDRTSAICDNLAWLALLIGGLLLIGGMFLAQPALTGVGAVLAAAGAIVIILFAGRDSKNVVARIMAGVVSLYGIVGYYGLVGFFSDGLSYMRLAILNMTSAFIAFVAQVIGGLFMGGGDSVVMVVIGAIVGGVIFVFFHLLNLVLSMLGAFVHSLRLNYLESFQRYYPEGGRAFTPFQRTGRFFRRPDERGSDE